MTTPPGATADPSPVTATPISGAARVRLPGRLSLVLPAHNEAENIVPVVQRALAVLPDYADEFEIIVVNDGSRDATGRIVDDLAANDGRVRAIHHPKNRGYGAALTSGFRASSGDHVMFMDSDRQFDIADIGMLTPFVPLFDIVAGFRMERNDPFHRRVFAEIFNVAVRILFGVHLRDIDCAFKIFRGDLIRSMQLTAPGALINTEIQAKARRQGATLVQIGVHHYPRIAGSATGGSWRVIARAMRETMYLWWRMHTYQPPTQARQARRPHLLGDIVVASASALGLATLAAVIRRMTQRRS